MYKWYSGHCVLRPPFQPEDYGLKLQAVLKLRVIYTENITIVLLGDWSLNGGIVKMEDVLNCTTVFRPDPTVHSSFKSYGT